MSHITQVKFQIELKSESNLRAALILMEKEGYKIVHKSSDEIWIDLSDRCKHYYDSQGQGAHWSAVVLKKNADGVWSASGDPWSIAEHYNTAVKAMEKNYILATVNRYLACARYSGAKIDQKEKTTSRSMGVIKVLARRY